MPSASAVASVGVGSRPRSARMATMVLHSAPSEERTWQPSETQSGVGSDSAPWWSKSITSTPARPITPASSPSRESCGVSTTITRCTPSRLSRAASASSSTSACRAANSRTFRFMPPCRQMTACGYSRRAARAAPRASKSMLAWVTITCCGRMTTLYGLGTTGHPPRTDQQPLNAPRRARWLAEVTFPFSPARPSGCGPAELTLSCGASCGGGGGDDGDGDGGDGGGSRRRGSTPSQPA